jgi:hypothetical protein
MKTARLLIAVLACLALAQPIAAHASALDIPAPHGSVPHAARSTRPPIVLIVLENHEYSSIVGSSSARWLNRSFIRRGTLFTTYHATHHPSLPNYLAMTSGTTSGCRSDTCPRRTYRTDNIFHQLSHAGIGWAGWIESMPSRCSLSSSGTYAVKHNPPAYYASLFPRLCRTRDRRYPGHLPAQLRPFTFVSPNVCHDMHSCSIGVGDRWLAAHVPPLWKRGAIVIITFDEGSSGTGGGGHVMTAIAGPHVPRSRRNHRSYSHYGLLAGLEHWFGLPRLHRAATARPLPI